MIAKQPRSYQIRALPKAAFPPEADRQATTRADPCRQDRLAQQPILCFKSHLGTIIWIYSLPVKISLTFLILLHQAIFVALHLAELLRIVDYFYLERIGMEPILQVQLRIVTSQPIVRRTLLDSFHSLRDLLLGAQTASRRLYQPTTPHSRSVDLSTLECCCLDQQEEYIRLFLLVFQKPERLLGNLVQNYFSMTFQSESAPSSALICLLFEIIQIYFLRAYCRRLFLVIQFTHMDPTVDTIKCTYKLGDSLEKSPHVHEPFRPMPKKIFDDVLDAIGNTPMIKINKVGVNEGIECELLAKCQFMNMGGSVKDRIGKRMVLDAEKTGLLKPGSKIVQATSGNTGIGLALASAVKGYECIICMPEKMSAQKANVLRGLGAKIIRTPNQASFDSPDSHIGISRAIHQKGEAILLDQYRNPSNPIAHYDQLAEEIVYQCDGKIDAVIVGVGTGGQMTGIARKIKEKCPTALLVGADPFGSILAMPQKLNEGCYPINKVQGIGYDFVPKTCERTYVDYWVKTDDLPSFTNARNLIQKEGLLVGGSSGSVMQAAFQFIKEKGWQNDKTKRVVCIFSDSIRNYITKFLSTEWCVENKFLTYDELKEESHIFQGIPLSELNFPEIKAYQNITVGEAKEIFEKGAKIIPLQKSNGDLYGAIFPQKFIAAINLKKLKLEDSATKTKFNDFVVVPSTLDLAQLTKILERNDAVLVQTRDENNKRVKLQVATIYDTLKYVK